MFPNLIPGDILSATEIKAFDLRPGMITVFRDEDGKNPVVHRVRCIRNLNSELLIATAGDNSGNDARVRRIAVDCSVTVVSGVLRKGRYRKITHFTPVSPLNRRLVMRVYRFVVKFFFW